MGKIIYISVLLVLVSACSGSGGSDDAGQVSTRILQLLGTQNITAILAPSSSQAMRPDAVSIGNEIYLAYGKPGEARFRVQRFSANRDFLPIEQPKELYSGEAGNSVDIRVGNSDGGFWYAFEDFNPGRDCGGHYLNAARYSISPLVLSDSQINMATGCITTIPDAFSVDPSNVPVMPEAVDDPTPIFYQGSYYIFTRAWAGWIDDYYYETKHHIRRLNADFQVAETFLLDLSPIFLDRTLSQSAMVQIENQVYLVGGFYNHFRGEIEGSRSDIYIVPLASDLKSVAGASTPLILGDEWSHKSTSAIYDGGLLYINFSARVNRGSQQWLAVFDPAQNFAEVSRILLYQSSAGQIVANHTSVVVKDSLIFAFYPIGNEEIEVQIFEWQIN